MLYNRHEFILRSHLGQLILNIDPMGSEETETSVGRSEKTFGIFTTVANNLKFIDEAKDFLEINYQIDGVNAEVELTKRMKHPQTDEWFIPKGFPGYLDFTTRNIEEGYFSVDFIEGGLKELLETQNSEKFEMDRTESVSGNPISELVEDELTIEGRDIYLLSKYDEASKSFTTKSGKWRSINENRVAFHPLNIKWVANSDPLNIVNPMEDYGSEERSSTPSILRMFFLNANRDIGKTKFEGSAKFKVESIDYDYVNAFNMKFVIKKYRTDIDGDNIEFIEDVFVEDMGDPVKGQSFVINVPEIELDPSQQDSFAMGFEMNGKYGATLDQQLFGSDGWKNYTFTDLEADFTWAEDSFFERTTAKFLPAFEVGNRLTEIISGKRKFVSQLLSQGDWKDLGFTCGGWLRQLQTKVENTDEQGILISTDLKPWSMDFSWDDFYKSIHATQPVGFGIVKKGAKEFLALERIRYFFQPYMTIKLGEVSNLKRSTAREFVFTSITTGYNKGGDYEEPLGLDEYNVQTTWTTPVIRGGDSKYEVISSARSDSYGVEQARRLPYSLFPDEDTPFDKDNFLIDAKFKTRGVRSNLNPNPVDYYDVRLWADDFELKPTGVYSPHTAFNLRLSPVNNLYRHAPWFNAATVKYKENKLLHASSEGNSELQTKPIGKSVRKEHEAIPISELSNPMFEPEWVEFETDSSQDLIDMIQGTTMINGEEISNYYGLVEYLADGKRERGYLFTATIKDTINWKILKAYGI